MMMRPKAVTVYLPFVEEVVDDFIARIKKIHNSDGTIENFRLEAAKWNLECKIPKPISWVIHSRFYSHFLLVILFPSLLYLFARDLDAFVILEFYQKITL